MRISSLVLAASSLLFSALPLSASLSASTTNCVPAYFSGLSNPEPGATLYLDSAGIRIAGATNVEFCRVKGHISTSATPIAGDSEIQFEVRLPTQWNSKYLQYGGAGADGVMGLSSFVTLNGSALSIFGDDVPLMSASANPTPTPLQPLNRGYAIAATNAGHTSTNPSPGNAGGSWLSFSLYGTNVFDRWDNYVFRARHLVALTSKAIVNLYYGQPPSYSYHGGLSNGGRNGLVEAALYPDDFDGVLAISPANELGGIIASWARNMQKLYPTSSLANPVIPYGSTALIATLGQAVMSKCDAQDGLADGIISDPGRCDFVPARDLPPCPGNLPASNCFTSGQIDFLQTLYTPTITDTATLYPKYFPGYENDLASEMVTRVLGSGNSPETLLSSQYRFGDQFIKYMIFGDSAASLLTTDVNAQAAAFLNYPSGLPPGILSPDLSAFKARGGKIVMVQGLADNLLSPIVAENYYNSVVAALGGLASTKEFARLFLIPGVGHLGRPTAAGAPAATDYLGALENWVENNVTPDYLNGVNTSITRPLCAYPNRAVYVGPVGDSAAIKVASNFECRYYNFGGVLPPVDQMPVKNAVKAGQGVPVQFSLGGNWGSNIFAAGYPRSELIACDSSAPQDDLSATLNPGNSSLQYDASLDQYTYVWKTDKSWAKGSCRLFTALLNDGTAIKAVFQFK